MPNLSTMNNPIAIPAGGVSNASWEYVSADNAAVATTYETVSNQNADTTFIDIVGTTAGLGIEAVSSDTKDDGSPAGVGAQTIKIYGLNQAWAQQAESITLDGTTATTATSNKYAFLNKVEVTAVGSELDAAGTITIRDSGDTTLALIDPAMWRAQQCQWQLAVGETGYCYGFWYNVQGTADGAGVVEFALQRHKYGLMGDVSTNDNWETIAEAICVDPDDDVVAATGGNGASQGFFSFPGGMPFKFEGKDIIRLAAKAGVTGATVSGGFMLAIQSATGGTTVTES